MDFGNILEALTLAAVAALAALVVIVKNSVEAGGKKVAELGAENANWANKLSQELEKVRGTERQELRFDAYAGLWKKQRPLAVYESGQRGPNTSFGPKEAASLLNAQSDWYFDEAGGLMLTTHVRDFYFAWQDLLESVARLPGWRAQRSAQKPDAVFRRVLGTLDRTGAIATLDYLKRVDGALERWPDGAGAHADGWRKDVAELPKGWGSLGAEEQFAVLQQVSSTLRTAMVFDIESRVR